ncbi:MAG: hypothetical protein JOZ43_05875, partial [Acidobacteriales bacterium]|nr:hypothetical protein [Terriglobales bacterium]
MTRLLLMVAAASALLAQSASKQIQFDFKFPGSMPPEYHMTFTPAGETTFQEPADDNQDEFRTAFQISRDRADWLFQTATDLHGFSGDYNYRKHKIAESGEKRLTLIDGDQRTGATFHYSENPQIQRLTA